MPKLHVIELTDDERTQLEQLTRRGQTSARRVLRARALLLADWGKTDRVIADTLGLHVRTVERLRERAASEGALAALDDRVRPGGRPKLSGPQEARLIAEACSDPPAGRACWTMQLLADRLVTLGMVESISDETVRRTLQKTISNPGCTATGAFPRSPVSSSGAWKPSLICTPSPTTPSDR